MKWTDFPGNAAALTRRTRRMAFSCQRGRVLRRFRQNACRVDTQNAQNADFPSTRQSFLLLTLGRHKNISYVCSVIVMLMKTTTVALGPHFDEFIQASVLGGRYTNASEVIRAGLRKLEEDERKIAALRSAIEEGEASGYVEDFDFEAHLQELNSRGRNNG